MSSTSVVQSDGESALRLIQEIPEMQSTVAISYALTDTDFLCFIEVESDNPSVTEVQIEHRLPLNADFSRAFVAREPSLRTLAEFQGKQHVFRYRAPDGVGIVLPILTVYGDTNDLGISFVQPFELPKPSSFFKVNTDDVEHLVGVSLENIRLAKNCNARSGVYLIVHEGDWRPGLGWMLKKYGEYFRPANKEVYRWEGNMMIADMKTIVETQQKGEVDFAGMGLRWVEVPTSNYVTDEDGWYFGRYVPEDPKVIEEWNKWTKIAKDEYGVAAMFYFQTYEMWDKVAQERFPDAICKDENGRNLPAFVGWGKNYALMHPDPELSWHGYIVEQGERLMQLTPEAPGIFWDRCDYPWFDYAHDDGISMVGDTKVYMLAFALEDIMKKFRGIADKYNKVIWANFPYYIELGKYYDGVMAENLWEWLMTLQYVSIARPIVMLNYWRNAADPEFNLFPEDITERENSLKAALIAGAFVSTQGLTEGEKTLGYDIFMKYLPLYQYFIGKEWVLDAHALDLPEECFGNIFTTPEHDYVVTIVSMDVSYYDSDKEGTEVTVTVRLKDGFNVGSIYAVSVDYEGKQYVMYERNGEYLTVRIPNHKSASLLVIDGER